MSGVRGRWGSAVPLVVAVLGAVMLPAPAGALRTPPAPLAIRAASLTQVGQDLVWRVTLAGRFSSAGLERDRRALCLLIERRESGTVAGQLCVAPPLAPGRSARLVYAQVTNAGVGVARDVVATVSQTGPFELTATFEPSAFGAPYRSLRWQVLSTVRASGCVPQSQIPGRCATLFPSQPTLAALHMPKLVGCVPAGPSLVYQGSPDRREIALTFDDGPWGTPPAIDFVDELARYHVPATFFEIGSQISEYDPTGAVERRMLTDGDMIGDHTWSHPDMVRLGPLEQQSELMEAADAIRKATGFEPCLWRPPYGAVSPQLDTLARSLGFLTVNWDIDPRDWATPGVTEIENNVIENARNGGIVELHNGGGPRFQTLAALPDIITTLRARGYRFVTVPQLLGLRLLYR